MGQPVSDGVFELHGACVHSLRFSFGAPLYDPYAACVQVSASHAPASLFRRLLAVSPPPGRGGAPWQTGMMLDDGPLDPAGGLDRLAGVQHRDGLAGLDPPQPETVVLDWWFDLPRRDHTVTFPGDDAGHFLTSLPCWDPGPTTDVEYFGSHRAEWTTKPQSTWIAVSFDAFWPAERDSADILLPLGACDDHCPD